MRQLITLLALAAMALCACEKELDFDYTDIEPLPVIEATLDDRATAVSFTFTTPMDEPMDTLRVTDAVMTVTDLTDGTEYGLTPDADGVYRAARGGVTGHRYRLEVERGGELFAAECVMAEPVRITDVAMEWIKMPYDHVAIIKVEFTDNPDTEGDAYWLRLYRNGKPYRWSVGDDRAARDGIASSVQMTTRRDTSAEDEDDLLVDGDVVKVTVARIDSTLYRMLEALTAGGSNGPEIWHGPRRCLGYFLASPLADTAVIFRPDSIP